MLSAKKETHSHSLQCNDGPYVWDKNQHLEGMGSTFQWRKDSLLAAHFLGAKWLGNLTNKHENRSGDQSTFFGLSYQDCNVEALKMFEVDETSRFQGVPKVEEDIRQYLSRLPLKSIDLKKVVLTFDWQRLDEAHNYAVFDANFRQRFHQQRQLR